MKQIDVAMMVYGKPYQTAVALHSLYKYSGHLINKIYVTFEKTQPFNSSTELVKELLQGLPVEYNVSKYQFGPRDLSKGFIQRLKFYIPSYRKSVKYQHAFEASRSKYLFILHNDMLFYDDLLTYYLSKIGPDIAVGPIGQCYNCPAQFKFCDSNKYFDYRPNAKEIEKLYEGFHNQRPVIQKVIGDGKMGWPLPECRLNEFAVLFNRKKMQRMTIPFGFVRPFGIHNNIDFGIPWFRDVSLRGIKFNNVDFDEFATHSWTNKHGGTPSLSNKSFYEMEEDIAKETFISKKY